ncbi:hypothetical protein Tco_0569153 [Tanacetum coccineum]
MLCRPDAPFYRPTLPSLTTLPPDRTALLAHREYDPTQGILDAEGIFLYNTPNEALKILKDKVLFQLDFSGGSQNRPNPKTVVSVGGNNINPNLVILVDKFEAIATKIDSEFMIISKEFKEMQDGHRDNHA